MRITDSLTDRWHASPRAGSVATTVMIVSTLALLQGCAANAPSCDGRFEPINLPAPASVSAAEEGVSSESESDHERR